MIPHNHHTGIHKIAPNTFFYLSVRDGKDCFTFEPADGAPLTEAVHYAKQFASWGHNTVATLRCGDVYYMHETLKDGRPALVTIIHSKALDCWRIYRVEYES